MKKRLSKILPLIIPVFVLIIVLSIGIGLYSQKKTEQRRLLELENRQKYSEVLTEINDAQSDLAMIAYMRNYTIDNCEPTIFMSMQEFIDYADGLNITEFRDSKLKKDEIDTLYAQLPELENVDIVDKMEEVYNAYVVFYEATKTDDIDMSTYELDYNNNLDQLKDQCADLSQLIKEDS